MGSNHGPGGTAKSSRESYKMQSTKQPGVLEYISEGKIQIAVNTPTKGNNIETNLE